MTTTSTKFTFAPTAAIEQRKSNSMVAKIDAIQGAFNLYMFDRINREYLRPISNGLYDVFCAYERGDENADELAADLLAEMKANPCHDLSGVMDAIASLSEARLVRLAELEEWQEAECTCTPFDVNRCPVCCKLMDEREIEF